MSAGPVAMDGVIPAPMPPLIDTTMESAPPVVNGAPEAAEPAEPAEPEYVSETLYIQNLNERVKVDGACPFHSTRPFIDAVCQ